MKFELILNVLKLYSNPIYSTEIEMKCIDIEKKKLNEKK